MGHIQGMELSGDSFEFIVYIYETMEDCIAMIIEKGYYRFERPAPATRGLWTDMAMRIRAEIESDVAYS